VRHRRDVLGERVGGARRVDSPERRVGQRARHAHAGLLTGPRGRPRRRVGQHGQGTHGGRVAHLLVGHRGGRRGHGRPVDGRPPGPRSGEGRRGEGDHVVGAGGGGPEGRQKQEAAGTTGEGGRHVVGWAEERVGEHRVAPSAEGLRREVAWRSLGVACEAG